ncbi:MAG TPA: DUF5722 domain-containing protein [Phycisphaerae bacterium]|nr:DUF5722 domain-containing protein [Phycisphaerae bacterium]HRR84764.1 DUF5722 domain-containing protein [Phycisphaerae bacterium]
MNPDLGTVTFLSFAMLFCAGAAPVQKSREKLGRGSLPAESSAQESQVQPASKTEAPVVKATSGQIQIVLPPGEHAGKVVVYELRPNEKDDAWRGKKPIETAGMAARRMVKLNVDRFERTPGGRRDRLYSKFVVVPVNGQEPIMPARFVEDFTSLQRRRLPFPRTRSKKGLQVQMVDDAIALGVQHAALNVDLARLFAWTPMPDAIPHVVDGERFLLNPSLVVDLDRRVTMLSQAGMTVTLILLNYANTAEAGAAEVLRHPNYNDGCPNQISAFNTATADGLRHYRAAVEFLIDRYTQPDGRFGQALGYIIGNEVNSHWHWCNMGEVSMEEFTEDYLRAMRIAATAAEKICPTARVYMSLEHHWNARFDSQTKSFPGRAFLELFARRAREQGDFAWHLAYHPYPDNLTEPAFWRDRAATTDVNTTPKITLKNIELLPEYLRRPELLYKGEPRRLILSEQGFHTKAGPDGEILQAAAFCAAFVKVAHIDGIDAFILHRHVDYRDEGGLKLGLWTRNEASPGPGDPGRPKRIHEVFRMADTPGWAAAFEFAKPIIGIRDWAELLPPSAGQPLPSRK